MQRKRLFIIIIIALLVSSNVYLAVMYTLLQVESARIQGQLRAQETSEKALVFAKLFIEKVLLSEGEVDFEDRLKLENAVREIDDQKILNEWQVFTKAENDKGVQVSAAKLLNLLFEKVSK